MKRTKTSTVLIVVGIIIAIIAAANLFLVYQENAGYDFVTILTGSMEPVFKVGDVVKVELGVTIDEIYAASKTADPPGDIILFRGPSTGIVHRAVEKISENDLTYVRTQGDANSGSAGWELRIGEAELVGKVVEINPPFWTYDDVFYISILGIGAIIAVIGFIVFVVAKESNKSLKQEVLL